jgi:hypothetical protein
MYDFMFLFVLQALNQSLFSLHVAMTLLESVPYAASDCNLIFPSLTSVSRRVPQIKFGGKVGQPYTIAAFRKHA